MSPAEQRATDVLTWIFVAAFGLLIVCMLIVGAPWVARHAVSEWRALVEETRK